MLIRSKDRKVTNAVSLMEKPQLSPTLLDYLVERLTRALVQPLYVNQSAMQESLRKSIKA